MIDPQERLAERDGWLYIKDESTDWNNPIKYTRWYPLKVRFADFKHRFGSEEEAREHLNVPVFYMGSDGIYRDAVSMRYRLVDGGKTVPEIVDEEPIPEPKQRGKKLPIEYRRGSYWKDTAKGWRQV